jgi:hypothetical protein
MHRETIDKDYVYSDSDTQFTVYTVRTKERKRRRQQTATRHINFKNNENTNSLIATRC